MTSKHEPKQPQQNVRDADDVIRSYYEGTPEGAFREDVTEPVSSVRYPQDDETKLSGGDIDAAGPFADALAVIRTGRLREAGIVEIGIGAYPEGHSRFPADVMEAALDEKLAAAGAAGLRANTSRKQAAE